MKVYIGRYPKSDKERKVDIRIDDWDTFSLDHTLAMIILPALIKFKECRKKFPGVPNVFLDDNPKYKDEHGNHTDEAIDIGEQKYEAFLDECIWAFDQIVNDHAEEKNFWHRKPEYDHLSEEEFKALPRFEDIPNSENKRFVSYEYLDREARQAYYDRIDQALIAFGKNFSSCLWW